VKSLNRYQFAGYAHLNEVVSKAGKGVRIWPIQYRLGLGLILLISMQFLN
jgi:hypothetical protein